MLWQKNVVSTTCNPFWKEIPQNPKWVRRHFEPSEKIKTKCADSFWCWLNLEKKAKENLIKLYTDIQKNQVNQVCESEKE